MRIFYIFWREYWSNVTRRSYLAFTFGFPIFMVAMPLVFGLILALAISAALPQTDPRPIGLIDQPHFLNEVSPPPTAEPVQIILFADTTTAAQALAQTEIQAYYDIQPDYWETGQVEISYNLAPTQEIDQLIIRWINQAVRAKAPTEILTRFDRGPTIIHDGLETQNSYAETDYIEPVIVYMLLYFVRLAGSFTASYMFDSIASEARDRTLEILVTTVSPLQFVAGKLAGLLAVGLTQIGMWAGVIVAFAIGISALLKVDLLGYLLTWEYLWLLVIVLLGTYLMDQILAAAMGLLRVSGGAGNLLFSTINSVVGISLIYAAYFVPRNPDSSLALFASLFPLTSPLVLLIRAVVSPVPTWQITLSLILLWGTNVLGILWLRHLLKTNLIAQADSFSLRRWLQERRVKIGEFIPTR